MFEEFENIKTDVADFKPFNHLYEVIKFKINIGRNPIIYDEDDENNNKIIIFVIESIIGNIFSINRIKSKARGRQLTLIV
jgi:hypothetical protein